jgi:hypothetical protein
MKSGLALWNGRGIYIKLAFCAVVLYCTNFRRVNINPASRFKKVENGNYCVTCAATLQLSLVNVGGLDIIDRNKKIILAVVSQLMRKYVLSDI